MAWFYTCTLCYKEFPRVRWGGNGYRGCGKRARTSHCSDKCKWLSRLLESARVRAREMGREFRLRPRDMLPLYTDTCPILGVELDWSFPRGDDNRNIPSLDRIDSSRGYTPDNVQVVSWRSNWVKSNATLEELVLLGEWAKKELERIAQSA